MLCHGKDHLSGILFEWRAASFARCAEHVGSSIQKNTWITVVPSNVLFQPCCPPNIFPHICFNLLLQKYEISLFSAPYFFCLEKNQHNKKRHTAFAVSKVQRKNGGTRWDGTLNNQPHIYTLYSGYHPKGPPPFSL